MFGLSAIVYPWLFYREMNDDRILESLTQLFFISAKIILRAIPQKATVQIIPNWENDLLIIKKSIQQILVMKYKNVGMFVSVSDVTPCKINDDCLHCCPSVRQQFTVLA